MLRHEKLCMLAFRQQVSAVRNGQVMDDYEYDPNVPDEPFDTAAKAAV